MLMVVTHLQEMEGEAYLLGNGFIIRFFEEYIKEDGMVEESKAAKKQVLTEQEEKAEIEPQEETKKAITPETVEEYRLRRKKIVADRLMRRWIESNK